MNDGRSLQFAFCLGTKLLKAPFFFFPFSSSSSSFFQKEEKKKRKAPGMVGDGGAETLVLCTWCSITGCWGAPGHLLVRLLSLPLCCMLGKEPLLRDVPFFSWRGPSETSLLMSSPPPAPPPLLTPPPSILVLQLHFLERPPYYSSDATLRGALSSLPAPLRAPDK